jgi:hypothetical protein
MYLDAIYGHDQVPLVPGDDDVVEVVVVQEGAQGYRGLLGKWLFCKNVILNDDIIDNESLFEDILSKQQTGRL